MKGGFGWAQGPFEMWDAIGVEKSVEKMKEEGREIPAFVQEMLDKGIKHSISEIDGDLLTTTVRICKSTSKLKKQSILKRYKKKHGVIKSNSGASLIDFLEMVLHY